MIIFTINILGCYINRMEETQMKDFALELEKFSPLFRAVPKTGVIYVMSKASERGFTYGHKDWANLGQGAPECGALPNSHQRMTHISLNEGISEYSPVAGLWELRESVASLYNNRYRRGMPSKYSAENVSISSGGRAGLTRIAAALGNIHLGHFLPDYTAYEELLGIFKNFTAIPIVLDPKESFEITPDRIEEEIIGKGLSALLFSNPSNPTGNVILGDRLEKIVSLSRALQCALIIDEFYSHYVYDAPGPELAISAAKYISDVDKDTVVLVDGLTKNWRYPGLRLSWTVAPKSVIERISSAGSFLDGGASHPIQNAAMELLAPSVADIEATAIQKHFKEKRQYVGSYLKSLGLNKGRLPTGGFYFFVDLESSELVPDGMTLFEKALDMKVITVPGQFFDVDPGQRRQHIPSRLHKYIRLSYGPSLPELKMGLDRIKSLFQ